MSDSAARFYPGHYTPRRPWQPMSDAEWAVLSPYLWRAEDSAGRPLATGRRVRMDAFLRAAVTGLAWDDLPPEYGRGNTVARHFRRLAHAGLWTRLLEATADRDAPPALRAMEHWVCRLARRAMRILRMKGVDLARRLGLLSALPMYSCFLPCPVLSRIAKSLGLEAARWVTAALDAAPLGGRALARHLPPPGYLNDIGRLHRMAGGRWPWSKRFAPP